jgi:hypothetical protein
MPVKLPVKLPTPPELARDPEFAALALLEASMHVAAYAIIAENMELCAQKEDRIDEQASLLTARDLLEKMEVLERDLERYRKQRTAEALASLSHPFDF